MIDLNELTDEFYELIRAISFNVIVKIDKEVPRGSDLFNAILIETVIDLINIAYENKTHIDITPLIIKLEKDFKIDRHSW